MKAECAFLKSASSKRPCHQGKMTNIRELGLLIGVYLSQSNAVESSPRDLGGLKNVEDVVDFELAGDSDTFSVVP